MNNNILHDSNSRDIISPWNTFSSNKKLNSVIPEYGIGGEIIMKKNNEKRKTEHSESIHPSFASEISLQKIYEINEKYEDEYLLAIVQERLKNDNGVRYSEADIMLKYGITEEDLDNVEDIEIE